MRTAASVPAALTDRERRRRRQELLEQREMTVSWRNRLLARRTKYIKAHRDLARRLAVIDYSTPPNRPLGG